MSKTKVTADHQLLPLVEHLTRLGRRAAESSTLPGGLRPRHLIALKLLSEHGPVSQQGLAEALSLDPSNVVGLLNELEDRKLITRRRDPADRRRHIVELSPLGIDEFALANARFCLIEDELLRVLSSEERETLFHLLARVLGAESPPCDAPDDPPCCPA